MPTCLIVVDRATTETRKQVHGLIKHTADHWWHHFTNVWVVSSELGPDAWRRVLRDTVRPDGDASLLVVTVRTEGTDPLAYYGVKVEKRMGWFRRYVFGTE